jgi:hypothetical protein
MKSVKTALASLILILAAIGGYWYFSPYWVVHAMRTAAEQQDAAAFNARVDYPRLRESIKGQLAAKLADELGSESESGTTIKALGAALAVALANPLIDAMVRPELVMAAMRKGEIEVVPRSVKDAVGVPEPKKAKPAWHTDRQGADRLVVYVKGPAKEEKNRVGLVFERSGFADWRLTELLLPDRL